MKRTIISVIIVMFVFYSLAAFTQPKVKKNEVTLWLSNGEVVDGLMIEIKHEQSPKRRQIIIWNAQSGFLGYYAEDVEALVRKGFLRNKINADLKKLQWKKKSDWVVKIKRGSYVKQGHIQGIVSNYNNRTGIYKVMWNPQMHFKDVGAIYFHDSDHSNLTHIKNKWAKPPTLPKHGPKPVTPVTPVTPVGPTNRAPDLVLNYPAQSRYVEAMSVAKGETLYFEVSGFAVSNINNRRPVGTRYKTNSKIKPGAPIGSILGFINPSQSRKVIVPGINSMFKIPHSGEVVMPAWGTLYLTINDKTLFNNAGNIQVKIWKN